MGSSLTVAQKSTLWDERGHVRKKEYIRLTARPGTGKTHTVTHYCIDLANEWQNHHRSWQGIAVLSYTNVAKREIERRVSENKTGYELLGFPHYIGTLDSFINNHIFLPFGARILGCESRPTLVGEPFSSGVTVNRTVKRPRGGIGYFDYKYYSYRSSYGLDNQLFLTGAQKDVQTNGAIDYYDPSAQIKLTSWIKVDGNYGVNSVTASLIASLSLRSQGRRTTFSS